MTELLRLDEEEEGRLGLAASTPWDMVGVLDETSSPTNTSSTTRRDTTDCLHAAGQKRKADELAMQQYSFNKRAK
jgi:hypothetical protein